MFGQLATAAIVGHKARALYPAGWLDLGKGHSCPSYGCQGAVAAAQTLAATTKQNKPQQRRQGRDQGRAQQGFNAKAPEGKGGQLRWQLVDPAAALTQIQQGGAPKGHGKTMGIGINGGGGSTRNRQGPGSISFGP
ncbi:MAG: hypothetical protein EBT75_05180 [Proteobacteria bacterium]|nr:hypothetical protein [Pseudomonadota bacterium]